MPPGQPQIEAALRRMAQNVNDPRLKTQHLSGQLSGLHACSAGYDCRIVFSKHKNSKTKTEVLLLINVGSHDQVY
jgi:mRNA interferase YafQ